MTEQHPALTRRLAVIREHAFPLRVLAEMAVARRPLTTAEVAERMDESSDRVGKCLSALFDEGLVERERCNDPALPPLAYRWTVPEGVNVPLQVSLPLHCGGG